MMHSEVCPDRIGPYVIDQIIGAGAHGQVYRAHHNQRPEVPVAVKIVFGRGNIDRLLLEPELLSRLNHPGIIRLLDYFLEGSDLVVVMTLVEGDNLETVLQQEGTMSPPAVRGMLIQLSQALQHAHEQQVLHRDIKLSNIMAKAHGSGRRFVLTDFGISRLSQGIQTSKQTAGTWVFMAPEQLRGRPGRQSDLWSLGVVAYRLLTGEYPFSGSNLEELTNAVLYREPCAIRDHRPDFDDPELELIIRKLLEKQLTERTSSAADLLNQLRAEIPLGQSPESPGPVVRPAEASWETYAHREVRRILSAWAGFWLCSVFMLLPLGLVAGTAGLLTILCFYFSHVAQKQSVRKALSALSVVGVLASFALPSARGLPDYLVRSVGPNPENQRILVQAIPLVSFFYYLAVAPVTVYFFSKARRMRRDLMRRNLSGLDMAQSDSYLAQLRALVAWHPQDLQLQHRYAEALLANGKLVDAAAESQLILENDPWNFAANLLLAQCYYDMGAYRECRAVCERYLSVSGHCFEFTDLHRQCLIGEGPVHEV